MRIGELAERADVSAKTIRYYESVRLLPEPDRLPNGYRDYGPGVLDRLAFIRAAQSVGLTLGEIREVLAFRDRGEQPCAHVVSLIERRAADLSERIQALETMRRDLIRLAKVARTTPARPAAYCHIIETADVLRRRPG